MEAYEDEEEEVENSTRVPRILSSEVRGQAEGEDGMREGRGEKWVDKRAGGERPGEGSAGSRARFGEQKGKRWEQNGTHTLWLQVAVRIRSC